MNNDSFTINDYEEIIESQTKVLFLKGRIGEAKTSIIKTIAKRNGWNCIPLHLAMVDESEIMGIPTPVKMKDGTMVMQYAVPEWAWQANQQPTLIFFDEYNRASLAVRNASLQILLDRQIGHSFKFNENVFFAAAGNIGEDEDGTGDFCEVEELDPANKDRMAIIRHKLTYDMWMDGFANDNVNKNITAFLRQNEAMCYQVDPKKEAFATFRGWTQLSKFIGLEAKNDRSLVEKIAKFAPIYVGGAATRFVRYLEDNLKITVEDVMNRYAEIASTLKDMPRDKMSELLSELNAKGMNKFSKGQIKNVIDFLKAVADDERIGFLDGLLMNNDYIDEKSKMSTNFEKIYKTFEADYDRIFASIKEDISDKK